MLREKKPQVLKDFNNESLKENAWGGTAISTSSNIQERVRQTKLGII